MLQPARPLHRCLRAIRPVLAAWVLLALLAAGRCTLDVGDALVEVIAVEVLLLEECGRLGALGTGDLAAHAA